MEPGGACSSADAGPAPVGITQCGYYRISAGAHLWRLRLTEAQRFEQCTSVMQTKRGSSWLMVALAEAILAEPDLDLSLGLCRFEQSITPI